MAKSTTFNKLFEFSSRQLITRELLDIHSMYFSTSNFETITIQFKNELDTINVQKYLLVHSSSVFNKMFSNEWEENKTSIIVLEDDANLFRIYYDFITGLEMTIDNKNIIDVIGFADKYEITCVLSMCDQLISLYMDKKNCVEYMIKLSFLRNDIILRKCVNYFCSNIKEINYDKELKDIPIENMKYILSNITIYKYNETLIFQWVLNYIRANNVNIMEFCDYISWTQLDKKSLVMFEDDPIYKKNEDKLNKCLVNAWKSKIYSKMSNYKLIRRTPIQYAKSFDELKKNRYVEFYDGKIWRIGEIVDLSGTTIKDISNPDRIINFNDLSNLAIFPTHISRNVYHRYYKRGTKIKRLYDDDDGNVNWGGGDLHTDESDPE